MKLTKLHLGANPTKTDEFLHVPIPNDSDLHSFVSKLSWPDRSIDAIQVDGLLEKISQKNCIQFLHECRRVMKPGARLEITVPDLDAMLGDYLNNRIDAQWEKAGIYWANNRCERLNLLIKAKGYGWLYNEQELSKLGNMVGLNLEGVPALSHSICKDSSLEPPTPLATHTFYKPNRRLARNAQPLVSISIPSFKPTYFEDALLSAINQTYKNIEVIICDDCPDAAIEKIVTPYAAKDPRIRYIRNAKRLVRENLVRCLEEARGEFFRLLCDDDLLDLSAVERMLNYFRDNDDITLTTSRRLFIDAHGSRMDDIFETVSPVPEDAVIEGISLSTALLSSARNFVGEPTTAMFRKAEVANIMPDYCSIDGQKIDGLNDVAVWVNLAMKGNVVYITDHLSSFRFHSEQNQNLYRKSVVELSLSGLNIMRRAFDRFGFSEGQFFGTLLWKPAGQPHPPWKASTIVPPYAGWKETPVPCNIPKTDNQSLVSGNAETRPPTDKQGRDTGLSYSRWIEKRTLDELDAQLYRERVTKLWRNRPLFELCLSLVPGEEALLADSIDALAGQYYDGWRLSIFAQTPSPEADFLAADSPVRWIELSAGQSLGDAVNARLANSPADWVGFYSCGTRFAPNLLLAVGDYIALHPEWRLIYTDEDAINADGARHSPLFKPDFNLELLRSSDYTGGHFVRRDTLLAAGGSSHCTGGENYDTVLRIVDTEGEATIGHLPDVLVHVPAAARRQASANAAHAALVEHLARRGIAADVLPGQIEGASQRIIYKHTAAPFVSIIIPTRNRLELLGPCIESLLKETPYPNWELILVDNGSDDPAVLPYYKTLCAALPGRVQVLHHPGPFDYAAMNNRAAQKARGDYLLLLNNDTVCIHDDWLEGLLNHGLRPDVGIVGARLLFPDTLKVQHAGVVLGMSGHVGHVFVNDLEHDAAGYLGRALLDQEYSAVTGACLLIRAALFHELGGLDEQAFKVSFNDIDLCLKACERGYRVIWTPFATLLHHGSASQLADQQSPEKARAFRNEADAFHIRWQHRLTCDPAWNRNLSLSCTTPTLEDELAAPWNTDFQDRPRILVMPTSSMGAAEYRNIGPLRALHEAGRLQYAAVCQPTAEKERAPSPVELARMAPDTLVMHAPVDNLRCLALLQYKVRNPGIFRIYSLDDLITNLPKDNPNYHALPAQVITERLQLGLAACHRMIVSTEPLLNTYRHLIDDIRLLPNRLSLTLWGDQRSLRRTGKKLRVGWAGAQQHAGDLRFVLDIVKASYQEVDWIFFGMLPEGAKPYVAEFHDYVHRLNEYPAKLASLNLDLAIAPLEIHPFNEAKSNLRLLEYGILGWPVICSDILPYRTDNPPVLRLPNDAGRWLAAIRERVADPDALARDGDALQAWVRRNYILEDHLDPWFDALTR